MQMQPDSNKARNFTNFFNQLDNPKMVAKRGLQPPLTGQSATAAAAAAALDGQREFKSF